MGTSLGDLFAGDNSLLAEGLNAATRNIIITHAKQYDADGVEIPLRFMDYVNIVNPRFVWHKHNVDLAHVLQDVADGKYGAHARVIIAEPPRHGKTEQVSKLFTSYWLYRWPHEWVGLVTYVADLSYSVSKDAMSYYVAACNDGAEWEDAESVLDAQAARHWKTTKGGGMWATGIGGPATGKGFHLGVIDDPVKNAEESQSENVGRRNREWYQSVFYTREAPEAHTAIIVMHTRWPGPGDMIGWLLEQEGSEDDEPERWHVVLMEAEKELSAEQLRAEIPATCTIEPDTRTPGQALCPARYDEKRLGKIKRRVGPYFWASIFQQRPRPREGGAFKQSWFTFVDLPDLRTGLFDISYWDLGGSEAGAGGDPTVRVKMRFHGTGDITILNVTRFFKTPAPRDRMIRDIVETDGIATAQWGPQDPAAAGKAEAWHFRTLLEGYNVHTEPVNGELQVLAGPYQSALEVGHIKLLRGEWNKSFIDEHLEQWEGAAHDDMVWAAANCYLKCVRARYRRNKSFTGSASFVSYR
jgi:phage terminase large subunit-like protein